MFQAKIVAFLPRHYTATVLVCCRNATLNYVLEAPNAEDLRSEFKATSSEAKGRDRKAGKQPAVKSQAWAKYQLPGHDLVGSAAWNQEYVDSAASYNTVPMAMSLDLASKDRPDGIQYRAGLHQVWHQQHDDTCLVVFASLASVYVTPPIALAPHPLCLQLQHPSWLYLMAVNAYMCDPCWIQVVRHAGHHH